MLTSAWLALNTEEFDVRTYTSALDFLRRLEPDKPGCLVTVIQMPFMTGIDLLTIIAELGLDMPAIVMSGDSDPSVAIRAMKAGALDVVGNPFVPEELVVAVREALTDVSDWADNLALPPMARWLQ